MNNNHKLAIIVPYRDRQKQLDVFIPHMKKFLSRPAQLEWYVGNLNKESYGEDRLRSSSSDVDIYLDYDIFVVEQSDEYPFNRGMLINSCVKVLPPEYDYFVYGQQTSYLSDISPNYPDITNDQEEGSGLKLSGKYHFDKSGGLEVYMDYWDIADSKLDISGNFMEPRNTTTELGLKFFCSY